MDNVLEELKDKPIVLPRFLFKYYKKLNITMEEVLILIYIIDNGDKIVYNPDAIAKWIQIDKYKVMELLSSLDDKKIISIVREKNSDGKSEEYISLDLFYKKVMNLILDNNSNKENTNNGLMNTDIFSLFENEFGRPISPMECEIIKRWIDNDFSYELITEALKEAIYNGVTSLRYIEKILYEWRKKGYKTKNDVLESKKKSMESKKETKDVFYYDWLNDD